MQLRILMVSLLTTRITAKFLISRQLDDLIVHLNIFRWHIITAILLNALHIVFLLLNKLSLAFSFTF